MSKPVLLLLPGLMCDRAVWQAQIDAFAADHEVKVPDFFGLDSIEDMARAALALTERPFALAGHSMGGRVAMQVAATAPERVQRLALLDTAAHPAEPEETDKRLGLVKIGERQGIEAVIEAWLPPMLAAHRWQDRTLWDAIAAMIRRAGVDTLRGQQRALLTRPDAFPQLDTVRVPTLFLTGALDGWSPPQRHYDMQAHVAGSTVTVVEDSGHMAPMEAPEAVNTALAAWLAS
jgi:pimeloyl-ACP methyl ester carboxylesterase